MADLSDLAVSNAALLELKEEIEIFRQGHRFLEEKRILLAQEMLKQVGRWREMQDRFEELHAEAIGVLRTAICRYGFEGLEVARPGRIEAVPDSASERAYLGLILLRKPAVRLAVVPPTADDLSDCRQAFMKLIEIAAQLAVCVADIRRLAVDYQRTERRTRALEDLLLPELDGARRDMESRLEETERDDVTRVRWFSRRSNH